GGSSDMARILARVPAVAFGPLRGRRRPGRPRQALRATPGRGPAGSEARPPRVHCSRGLTRGRLACHKLRGQGKGGMRRTLALVLASLSAAAGGSLAARPAAAFGHLWHITEVFSNPDGSVQFIELASQATGENALSVMFLRSQANA